MAVDLTQPLGAPQIHIKRPAGLLTLTQTSPHTRAQITTQRPMQRRQARRRRPTGPLRRHQFTVQPGGITAQQRQLNTQLIGDLQPPADLAFTPAVQPRLTQPPPHRPLPGAQTRRQQPHMRTGQLTPLIKRQ
ncbi:hypothetical protein [Actinomadura fulvescens]|uniref:hypothetical protein n=1 Tax=Actinomadura fulvescens TaxID=46160 RepID=UPI0031D38ADF